VASPQWKFILANSSDMSNIGELTQARGRQLQLALNRPGAASFTIPLDDELGNGIWPITHAVKAYRKGSDDLWQHVWSGMVWTIEEDISGNRLSVNVVGWLQWLEKRILRRDKAYTGNNPATTAPWTDAEILYDILVDANTSTLTWDSNYVVPTPYTNGTTPQPTPVWAGVMSPTNTAPTLTKVVGAQTNVDTVIEITAGTGVNFAAGDWVKNQRTFEVFTVVSAAANALTVTRGTQNPAAAMNDLDQLYTIYKPANTTLTAWRSHERLNYAITKGASILGEFTKLTDIENGIDIEVNPSSRALNVWDKKIRTRSDAVFGYGFGPNNLQQFSRQLDPTTIVNYIYVAGRDSTVIPAYADTKLMTAPSQNPPKLGENSMTTYGLIEETAALSDGKNLEILQTYASGEIIIRSSPRIIYSMTPFPFTTEARGQIPEPFVDYIVGDKVYLTAYTKGRIDIRNQGIRIFGISVDIDDDGNEKIGQLQTSPT